MSDSNKLLNSLLCPSAPSRIDLLAMSALPLLLFSAVLILVAAWAMPAEYSWHTHSISESAAQGQPHAWIARLSFLAFGTGVLLLSIALRGTWPRLTYWSSLGFAFCMFAVAAFSHAPWQQDLKMDAVEDMLHSLFASGMGFLFVLGVVIRFVQRGSGTWSWRLLDAIALLTATVLPMVMVSIPESGGVAQRVMFSIGYIWFGREALAVVQNQRTRKPRTN